MNRYTIAALLFLVVSASLTWKFWPYVSKPTLIVKFDGKPIEEGEIILPDGLSFDEDGVVLSPNPGEPRLSILFKSPNGCYSISFPNHGTKTVNICGDITYTTVKQFFGMSKEQTTSLNLSDEDAERLVNDEVTFQELQQAAINKKKGS